MSAPDWYRCKACGRSDGYLAPFPKVYRPRPPRGWSSAYQMLVPGSDLYCMYNSRNENCLPVRRTEWQHLPEVVVGEGDPIQIGLGL